MAVKVNSKNDNLVKTHRFEDHHAFLDQDGDFWLISSDKNMVCRITAIGCICEPVEAFITIEDFLYEKYDCGVLKVFSGIADYTITIDC